LKRRAAEANCLIIVVNAARAKAVNCTSGELSGFKYLVELPVEKAHRRACRNFFLKKRRWREHHWNMAAY
jgi:hypothetical protein